ncbi:ROK family protein [Segetibacter sp. 3557_3]|uniref:ROK family protein n=1 Tax=Segetibacter sp. 3557_3 TaxID=2547429 RepID=UPI0010587060|nr:ROK family protein [Segetibacter sp. 3557_3]TDH27039.1 ROK family protein [Segetibacter sp. 3557_3]
MDYGNELAIGIDIGGTNTKYGIVNHRGVILQKGELKTDIYEKVEPFIDALYEKLAPIVDLNSGEGALKGIGIGAPNANYYNGTIEHAPNLNWKGVIPFARMVSERFGLPCSITNDANAAAVGEMSYGAARGMKNFIMITLGTGVGSGIVANGQLIYGEDGFAGELGHTIVRYGGRKHPSTGLLGSLEAYASATGIVVTAKEMIRDSAEPSLLRDLNDELTSKTIFESALKGDKLAREVFRFTGQVLGEALANFVMFSSPEAIILFGGVIKAGDLLLEPTKQYMEKNLLPVFQNKVKIIFSELEEADAAILGASALVWEMKYEDSRFRSSL